MNIGKITQRKRELIELIFIVVVMVVGIVLPCKQANAYTEEEKAQAKAWLSAHGYSPDAGGASAAYQDYLNGKFDEELGITREASTEAETQSAYDDGEDKKEKTTEEKASTENTAANNNQTANAGGSVWDIMGDTSEESTNEISTEEITEEITTEEEPSTQIAYDEPEDEEDIEDGADDEEEGTIMTYLSEHRDVVIGAVLSVLVIVIIAGVLILIRK